MYQPQYLRLQQVILPYLFHFYVNRSKWYFLHISVFINVPHSYVSFLQLFQYSLLCRRHPLLLVNLWSSKAVLCFRLRFYIIWFYFIYLFIYTEREVLTGLVAWVTCDEFYELRNSTYFIYFCIKMLTTNNKSESSNQLIHWNLAFPISFILIYSFRFVMLAATG